MDNLKLIIDSIVKRTIKDNIYAITIITNYSDDLIVLSKKIVNVLANDQSQSFKTTIKTYFSQYQSLFPYIENSIKMEDNNKIIDIVNWINSFLVDLKRDQENINSIAKILLYLFEEIIDTVFENISEGTTEIDQNVFRLGIFSDPDIHALFSFFIFYDTYKNIFTNINPQIESITQQVKDLSISGLNIDKLSRSYGRTGYTITQLKDFSKLYKLSSTGNKSDLTNRLLSFLK